MSRVRIFNQFLAGHVLPITRGYHQWERWGTENHVWAALLVMRPLLITWRRISEIVREKRYTTVTPQARDRRPVFLMCLT